MDERHLYFAALVASPWLAIGGATALAYSLLPCCDPGQLASGVSALTASALAGELAWCRLWAIAVPALPSR
jgi:hypothetical protein